MKYCKKCGAEIPEGASFCERCGNPVNQVSQVTKKKHFFIGICIIVVVAVSVIMVLFAIGVIGGRKKSDQTNHTGVAEKTDTPVQTESAEPEEPEQNNQKSDIGDDEEMTREAYDAYKAYIEEKKEEREEDSEEIYQYALFYLDSDDYPELLEHCNMPTVGNITLYTYKDSGITNTEFYASAISYKEHQNYIYDACRHSALWGTDVVGILDGTSVMALFNGKYECDELEDPDKKISAAIDDKEVSAEEYEEQLAGYIGNEADWESPEFFDSIDEAFTNLLKKNKQE